jgi:hypothetical protein
MLMCVVNHRAVEMVLYSVLYSTFVEAAKYLSYLQLPTFSTTMGYELSPMVQKVCVFDSHC